jgi:hypothetical protein
MPKGEEKEEEERMKRAKTNRKCQLGIWIRHWTDPCFIFKNLNKTYLQKVINVHFGKADISSAASFKWRNICMYGIWSKLKEKGGICKPNE